jgi:hypothetical protein
MANKQDDALQDIKTLTPSLFVSSFSQGLKKQQNARHA